MADPRKIRFRCRSCAEWHEGVPDLAFDLPDMIHAMDAAERARRARITSDSVELDGAHFFVRGVLMVPVLGEDMALGLGAWSTLSPASYARYSETFDDDDQGRVGPFFGWFANRVPGYPDTLGLKCSVQPQDGNQRPRLTLEPGDHPLAIEQRAGITLERLEDILGRALHGVQ